MAGIKFKNLDEYIQAMAKTGKNADKKIRKFLNKQGKDFIEEAKDITPYRAGGKRHIRDSYVSKQIQYVDKGYTKPITNKAPHHHLVNNGHRLVTKSGKVIGYVSGQRYIERTTESRRPKFDAEAEAWLNELYKDLL